MAWLAASLGLVFLALWFGGALFLFKAGRARTGRNHVLRILGLAAACADAAGCLRLAPLENAGQFVAMPLLAGASLLFVAAWDASRCTRLGVALAPHAPATLLRRGPYSLVRHPFYVSYVLGLLGLALLLQTWWAAGFSAALVPLYVTAAMQEERLIAGSPLREQYASYSRAVGRFVPRLFGPASRVSACS